MSAARLGPMEHTGTDERPNAVPYFFATLTSLVREATTPRGRSARTAPTPISVPAAPAACDDGASSGHPLWHDLLTQLRGTVAPGALARLARASVLECGPDRLVLWLPSQAERAWCERMLRARVEEVVAEMECPGTALVLSVEAGQDRRLLACSA